MFRLMLRLSIFLCAVILVGFLVSRVVGAGRPRDWLAFTTPVENAKYDLIVMDVTLKHKLNLSRLIPNASGMDTSPNCSEHGMAWSNDGRMAFVQTCDSNFDTIRIFDFTAQQVVAAIKTNGFETQLQWSNDGCIAFISRHPAKDANSEDLRNVYISEPSTAAVDKIRENVSIFDTLSWSRDGQLAFSGSDIGYSAIYIRDRQGKVSDLNLEPPGGIQPAWSPNGKQLAYITRGFIQVLDLTTDTTSYFVISNGNATGILWSPDGLLTVITEFGDDFNIHLLSIETGEVVNLTPHPAIDFRPAWSSDGRLAFISTRDGKFNLYVLNIATGTITNMSGDLVVHDPPAWAR